MNDLGPGSRVRFDARNIQTPRPAGMHARNPTTGARWFVAITSYPCPKNFGRSQLPSAATVLAAIEAAL